MENVCETKNDTVPLRESHMNWLFCHLMQLCRVFLFSKASGIILALMTSSVFCHPLSTT